MPKFVELDVGAGSMWVNPWLIRFVGTMDNEPDKCAIHFDKDHYFQLPLSAASVIAKLNGPT